MSPRKAFTLIELLVVIAIILILMGMIMGGVKVAQTAAVRAKAVGLVGQLASAIDQYRSLNSCYPERLKKPSTSPMPASWTGAEAADTSGKLAGLAADKEVYGEAFAGGSAAAASDWWTAVNATLVSQLGSLGDGLAKDGLVKDPWGAVLRYRPAKWYPYTAGAAVAIDSDKPPNPDAFQLWSAGKNTTDEYGQGDDIANWQK